MNKDWLAVFEALQDVYTGGAYSNIAVNEAVSHHRGCRESFVRTFAKGVLRDSIKLDYIIDRLAAKGIGSVKKRPLIIIRMGMYAIRSLDSVPAHAAVSEAVSLSKSVAKGNDRFINGMLRNYIRRSDEFSDDKLDANVRHSIGKEVYSLLAGQYGSEAEQLAAALNEPPGLFIRTNTLKTDRESLISMLREKGFDASASDENSEAVSVKGSGLVSEDLFRKGFYTIQSLSSMIAVKAFSPSPGSRVLDLCSAPGGKTGYMAELMNNEGQITACDIHPHRLALTEASVKRLGVRIVSTRQMDASVFEPELENSFDYVAADVPCSGLGVIAGKPEIKINTDITAYDELAEIQSGILHNAVRYAKPGGMIMYSTCTLNKNENEEVVKHLLSSFGSLVRVVETATVLPYNGKVGFFYSIIGKNAI